MRKHYLLGILILALVASSLGAAAYRFGDVTVDTLTATTVTAGTINNSATPNVPLFPSITMQRMSYFAVTPALASTNSNNFSGLGDTTTSTSSNCGSGAGGNGFGCTTVGTTNAVGWDSTSTSGYLMGKNIFAYKGISITTSTNERAWITMSTVPIATMCASATPAASYLGFRFDTGAGDASWQAISSDGTQEITSTGVGATAGIHFVTVQSTTLGNVKYYINGNLVATHSTHIPAANAVLKVADCVRSLSGSGSNIGGGYMYVFYDN